MGFDNMYLVPCIITNPANTDEALGIVLYLCKSELITAWYVSDSIKPVSLKCMYSSEQTRF